MSVPTLQVIAGKYSSAKGKDWDIRIDLSSMSVSLTTIEDVYSFLEQVVDIEEVHQFLRSSEILDDPDGEEELDIGVVIRINGQKWTVLYGSQLQPQKLVEFKQFPGCYLL